MSKLAARRVSRQGLGREIGDRPRIKGPGSIKCKAPNPQFTEETLNKTPLLTQIKGPGSNGTDLSKNTSHCEFALRLQLRLEHSARFG